MSSAALSILSEMPLDEKRKLFALLARDLSSTSSGSVSIIDADGEMVLYRIPKNAREMAERAMRAATPEEIAEMKRRAADLDNTFSFEEALRLPPDHPSESDG